MVIVSGGTIVQGQRFLRVCAPSVTRTVNVVPVAVGVPLITPVADKLSPVGNDPVARDQVFEPVPPVAARVCEYVVPCIPVTNDNVVIVSTTLTLIVRDFCADWTPSAACTVNVAVPVPVGVPLITPAADNVDPVGNDPVATDQVFEPVPPVVVSVCE